MLTLAVLAGVLAPSQAASAAEPWDRTLDISFPTLKGSWFSNDYYAPRGGGTRTHCSTDVLGKKHQPIYAARGGKITSMPTTKPSYGYTINIAGDDGRRYSYLHLNDDTPGTQNDSAGPGHAYAPGLKVGSTVRRGQHIAYLGDSGNAKGGPDHLHFEIHDPNVTNGACANRVNPYNSLVAAVNRGDFGGTPAPPPPSPPARTIDRSCPEAQVAGTTFPDVSGTHARAINCVAWWKISVGRNGRYLPHQGISREQLASFVDRTFDAMGKPLPRTSTDHFADDGTSIHHDAINRLAAAGIVSGTAPGRFSPGTMVTRAQMATVVAKTYERAAGRALPAGADTFLDDDGNTHEASINRLAAARIAVGTNSESFEPLRTVSRAEMASLLARTLDLLVEQRAASLPR